MGAESGDCEAGFTLIEMMVVLALATIVTVGILTFYLSAQGTWTDASSQALAQRDGTSVLETIESRAQDASSATIIPNPVDGENCMLLLWRKDLSERARFFWSDKDSLIHWADNGDSTDQGPLVGTRALRFHCSQIDTLGLISVDSLRMVTANGQMVVMRSSFGMTNRILP